MQRLIKWSNGKGIFLYSIPLVSVLLLFLIKAKLLGYSDFASYYFGSKLLLSGEYKIAYDTAILNQAIYAQGFKELFVSYTPFPPFTSVFFAPFTFLPIGTAKIIFNYISCIFFFITLYRSFKYFTLPVYYLLFVPLLFYIPLQNNLFFGQSYLLLFCFLMEGFIAYKKEQAILYSLFWGLAIVFKLFPLLIFFYLLSKKEYKNIAYLAGTCFLFFLSSLLINGVSPWQFYFSEIFPRLNNGELNDSYTCIFQSAFMLLKNAFVYEPLLNPNVTYNNFYLFWILLALFKAFLFSVCVISSIRKNVDDFLNFALWMTAAILISPNGSTYSLILLLIPFLALVNSSISDRMKLISIILLFFICTISIGEFSSFPLLLKFPRLYLMVTFFILLALVAKIGFDKKVVAGFTLIFLVQGSPLLLVKPDDSTSIFKEDKYALIYDYSIKENKLYCSYWSVEGGKEEAIDFPNQEFSSKNVLLHENQIYYKRKQITNTPDWKRNPILVDNSYIIYMSDKNRGVGFYSLRKIKI